MKKSHFSCTLLVCLFVVLVVPAKAQDAAWQELFDGKTLNGWVQRGGKAKYSVEDGIIVGSTVKGTPNSFLCTENEYANFILELEFQVDPKLNSGIQVRSECFDQKKTYFWKGKTNSVPAGRVHGYQIEIDPSARAWTAGIYDEGRRGWLNDLKGNEAAQKAFKQNEWNKVRVEARGNSLKTWLNGVPAADLKDDMTPKGFIALQVHNASASDLQVKWRNIRLQNLGN